MSTMVDREVTRKFLWPCSISPISWNREEERIPVRPREIIVQRSLRGVSVLSLTARLTEKLNLIAVGLLNH
jgi:hypothetical protein